MSRLAEALLRARTEEVGTTPPAHLLSTSCPLEAFIAWAQRAGALNDEESEAYNVLYEARERIRLSSKAHFKVTENYL